MDEKIIKYIQDFHKQYQWAPSVREIAKEVGLSPSTIQTRLSVLQAKGKIVYQGVRQVRVIE